MTKFPEPDRLPWPADWLTEHDPADARLCRDMWACVLHQAVWEALAGESYVSGQGKGDVFASDWIGSRDFHEVCELAGYDGDAVASRLAARLARKFGAATVLAALATSRRRLPGAVAA